MDTAKKCTCALFILTPSNRVLLVHPTGMRPDKLWSLPKGVKEDLEEPREAAARECLEETGLDFRGLSDTFIDLGTHLYTQEKRYHLFMLKVDREIDVDELNCSTSFTDRNGNYVLEVDQYKVVSLDEAVKLLNPKQSVIFSDALSVIQS